MVYYFSSSFSSTPYLFTPRKDLSVNSSADDALEEELRYLQAETYVITASRIPENIKKTAASVTVVTDKQIRQMGARNLMDVLETVPGWSNYYAFNGFNLSNVRGIVNYIGLSNSCNDQQSSLERKLVGSCLIYI